jgi:hypothetical protein
MNDAPVLFLIFNRLDTTKKVFAEIRKAKPSILFIASDGPRNKKEEKIVNSVRKYVIDNIDWDCKVKTLFRKRNLGCKLAISQGITWFFEHVEEGIILEDDCLPNQSFFRFCSELLKRYEKDSRVMMIAGSNLISNTQIKESYIFSNNANIWGWATWRRAWKLYDVNIKKWPEFNKKKALNKIFDNYLMRKHYEINFNLRRENFGDTWDYQWGFACLYNRGLTIIPKFNLISNIGSMGHHTYSSSKLNFNRTHELSYPLVHPDKISVNKEYDDKIYSFLMPGILKLMVFNISRKILKKLGLFNFFWNSYLKLK